MKHFIYLAALAAAFPLFADSVDERLARMEKMMQSMQQQMQQKDAEISDLRRQLGNMNGSAAGQQKQPASLLDRMTSDLPTAKGSGPGIRAGGGNAGVRLIDISAIVSGAAGGSTADDDTLDTLQGGAHDPKKRGFNFQQLELSLAGAVDPFFDVETHVIFTEDEVELEEAFATTTSLPANLQVKAGYFFTEFGRQQSQHPHSWDWIDQTVINTRIFGGEGQRNVGAQLAWQAPLPWYSQLQISMHQAEGAFMASFDGEGLAHAHGDEEEEHHDDDDDDEHAHEHEFEEGIGGRPIQDREVDGLSDFVYTLRFTNGFDLTDSISMQLGTSAMFGPNNTGDSSDTAIYGLDLVLKGNPAGSSTRRPKWVWQSELIKREYEADALTLEGDEPMDTDDDLFFAEDTLDDWGFYTQFSYTLNADWSLGFRAEYATGDGASYEEGAEISRDEDPYRSDRVRLSPLVTYHPSEFSRLRLQYNYDDADHLEDEEHTLWLGFEWLIGSHPAHKY